MGLLVALGFLTIVPVPGAATASPRALGRAAGYFPLVGALLGVLLAGLDWLLSSLLPAGPRAAVLVTAGVVLTRGLHLDGLMDSCDGLFGGFTAERRLSIMRDSAIGAFGALGAGADLLLRYACLAALAGRWRVVALVFAPVLGRWALTYALVAFPYARKEGLGRAFHDAASRRELVLATAFALATGSLLWWPWGAALLVPAWGAAWLVARWTLAQIPGLTGDSYGAINEVVEVTLLLLACAAQTRWPA